jgi:aminoglycoside phosphotransferase
VDGVRGASATAIGGLEQLVRQRFGAEVLSVSTRPFRYATTHAMTEIDVIFADGSRRALLHKDLTIAHRLPEAKGNRPGFLDDPGREVHVYRSILTIAVPGIPACFASEADDDAGAWWLLIEKVPGVELWQIGALNVWCDVARWAAALHHQPIPADPAVRTRLVSYDRTFFEHWPNRARQFAERWEPGRRHQLTEVLQGYEETVDALAELPRCLIHGELYPSNVLVDRTTGRISAVDWEMAGVGAPLLDLSSLVAGGWSDTERHAVITAYHSALPADDRPPIGQLVDNLMRCELHRCIQWLGWAPGWQPPSEHRHNWLESAILLAERLRRR